MLTVYATEISEIYGHGRRFVIWFSGCTLHCKGCMNQDLWDRSSGEETTADALLAQIVNSHVDGVTYIGGEPLQQGEELLTLSERIRKIGLDIVLFTGYEPEEFDDLQKSVADLASVIIAGRYVECMRDTYLTHRGSSNQKVIIKDESLRRFYSGEARQVEIIITEDSETYLGFPEDFLGDASSDSDHRLNL
jgi:anaerobic ribonucleoside-triphosphate reductase activating protein